MSTRILEALPGKLYIKRHSTCILYISTSLAMSKSVRKALPGKLDIKRHSPSIIYISTSLMMSTSVLEALPGKLDIKRYSLSILYTSASLKMSTSILKALPGKLDIKRHSPSILYIVLPTVTYRSMHLQEHVLLLGRIWYVPKQASGYARFEERYIIELVSGIWSKLACAWFKHYLSCDM